MKKALNLISIAFLLIGCHAIPVILEEAEVITEEAVVAEEKIQQQQGQNGQENQRHTENNKKTRKKRVQTLVSRPQERQSLRDGKKDDAQKEEIMQKEEGAHSAPPM